MKKSGYVYKSHNLKNGLRCLLVSSHKEGDEYKDSGYSMASIVVGVGNFSVPPNIPGLGHLLEHIVFLGSAKYQRKSEFDYFLEFKGGRSNGVTGCEATKYSMKIPSKHFERGLDYLSNMLKAPLLTDQSTYHELEMVDAEWSLKRRYENVLYDHLITIMAKNGHPLGRFLWGNKQSLSPSSNPDELQLPDVIRKFYKDNYSATITTAVLLSSKPISELERLIDTYFNDFRATNEAGQHSYTGEDVPYNRTSNPMDNFKFHRLYKVTSPCYSHILFISWILPASIQKLNSNPVGLIGYILGHKAHKSLQSLIIAEGLGCDVTVRDTPTTLRCSCMTPLCIRVNMTSMGLLKYWTVINYVYQSIQQVRGLNESEARKVWRSKVREEAAFFENVDEDYLNELGLRMQTVADNSYLDADVTGFSFEDLKSVTSRLTPDTVNVTLMSPDIIGNKRDEFSIISYTDEEIPVERIQELNNAGTNTSIGLPVMTPYLPSSYLTIKERSLKCHEYISKVESEGTDSIFPFILYHHSQDEYDSSYTHVNICLHSTDISIIPSYDALVDLYVQALSLELSEEIHLGVLACITTLIQCDRHGIKLLFEGYSDKLFLYIKTVWNKLSNFTLNQSKFSMAKDLTEISYKNQIGNPVSRCREWLQDTLHRNHSFSDVKLNQLKSIDLSDMKNFLIKMQQTSTIVFMLMGNITKEDSVQFASSLSTQLKFCDEIKKEHLKPNYPVPEQMKEFDNGNIRICVNKSNLFPGDENSTIQNIYLRSDSKNNKYSFINDYVCLDILVRILEDHYYIYLRNKYRLGFDLKLSLINEFPTMAALSIMVLTQATRFTGERVDHYIDKFLKVVSKKYILPMTSNKFNLLKDSALYNNERGDLTVDFKRNWNEVICGSYHFTRPEDIENAIKNLSLTTFQDWLRDFLEEDGQGNLSANKISIRIEGQGTASNDNGPDDNDDDDDDDYNYDDGDDDDYDAGNEDGYDDYDESDDNDDESDDNDDESDDNDDESDDDEPVSKKIRKSATDGVTSIVSSSTVQRLPSAASSCTKSTSLNNRSSSSNLWSSSLSSINISPRTPSISEKEKVEISSKLPSRKKADQFRGIHMMKPSRVTAQPQASWLPQPRGYSASDTRLDDSYTVSVKQSRVISSAPPRALTSRFSLSLCGQNFTAAILAPRSHPIQSSSQSSAVCSVIESLNSAGKTCRDKSKTSEKQGVVALHKNERVNIAPEKKLSSASCTVLQRNAETLVGVEIEKLVNEITSKIDNFSSSSVRIKNRASRSNKKENKKVKISGDSVSKVECGLGNSPEALICKEFDTRAECSAITTDVNSSGEEINYLINCDTIDEVDIFDPAINEKEYNSNENHPYIGPLVVDVDFRQDDLSAVIYPSCMERVEKACSFSSNDSGCFDTFCTCESCDTRDVGCGDVRKFLDKLDKNLMDKMEYRMGGMSVTAYPSSIKMVAAGFSKVTQKHVQALTGLASLSGTNKCECLGDTGKMGGCCRKNSVSPSKSALAGSSEKGSPSRVIDEGLKGHDPSVCHGHGPSLGHGPSVDHGRSDKQSLSEQDIYLSSESDDKIVVMEEYIYKDSDKTFDVLMKSELQNYTDTVNSSTAESSCTSRAVSSEREIIRDKIYCIGCELDMPVCHNADIGVNENYNENSKSKKENRSPSNQDKKESGNKKKAEIESMAAEKKSRSKKKERTNFVPYTKISTVLVSGGASGSRIQCGTVETESIKHNNMNVVLPSVQSIISSTVASPGVRDFTQKFSDVLVSHTTPTSSSPSSPCLRSKASCDFSVPVSVSDQEPDTRTACYLESITSDTAGLITDSTDVTCDKLDDVSHDSGVPVIVKSHKTRLPHRYPYNVDLADLACHLPLVNCCIQTGVSELDTFDIEDTLAVTALRIRRRREDTERVLVGQRSESGSSAEISSSDELGSDVEKEMNKKPPVKSSAADTLDQVHSAHNILTSHFDETKISDITNTSYSSYTASTSKKPSQSSSVTSKINSTPQDSEDLYRTLIQSIVLQHTHHSESMRGAGDNNIVPSHIEELKDLDKSTVLESNIVIKKKKKVYVAQAHGMSESSPSALFDGLASSECVVEGVVCKHDGEGRKVSKIEITNRFNNVSSSQAVSSRQTFVDSHRYAGVVKPVEPARYELKQLSRMYDSNKMLNSNNTEADPTLLAKAPGFRPKDSPGLSAESSPTPPEQGGGVSAALPWIRALEGGSGGRLGPENLNREPTSQGNAAMYSLFNSLRRGSLLGLNSENLVESARRDLSDSELGTMHVSRPMQATTLGVTYSEAHGIDRQASMDMGSECSDIIKKAGIDRLLSEEDCSHLWPVSGPHSVRPSYVSCFGENDANAEKLKTKFCGLHSQWSDFKEVMEEEAGGLGFSGEMLISKTVRDDIKRYSTPDRPMTLPTIIGLNPNAPDFVCTVPNSVLMCGDAEDSSGIDIKDNVGFGRSNLKPDDI